MSQMKNNIQVDSSCKLKDVSVSVRQEFPATSYFHFMNSPTLLTLMIFIIKIAIIHKTYNEDRQFNNIQSNIEKQIEIRVNSGRLSRICLKTRGCENQEEQLLLV